MISPDEDDNDTDRENSYPAEIFPVEVRALGNAITTFTNWTINLIFAQFSPQALTSIGFRYFYVFFVFNLIALLCYIFFYPETKVRKHIHLTA